jgi:hypothetical protein
MKQAMALIGPGSRIALLAALHLLAFSRAAQASGHPPEIGPVGFLLHTNYHGWTDAIVLSNGRVEAVIVPAIGRVMQFRLAGADDGPFWENRALDGKAPDPAAKEWVNFGGDKTWPSPQADWPRITPRAWPPPVAFDSMPVEAKQDGFIVTLVSAVDPDYGIRTRREIQLDLDLPVMTITTTYQKVSGQPLKTGVWVITQLKDPVLACASLPDFESFREGYNRQSEELPAGFKIDHGLVLMTRDPKAAHKIGTDAGALFWVGTDSVLRIESPRRVFGDYPDEGCSAEIYTNPDPLPYVELEMLGPVRKMIVGNKITRRSTYTLVPRVEADPDLEVRRLLSH